MKQLSTKILRLDNLNEAYFVLSVANVWQEDILPGQFAQITVHETFLRKPFSIFDADRDQVRFLIKKVGQGSIALSKYLPGAEIEILLPLGNSFSLNNSKQPLLIAGGCGLAPVYFLAKKFKAQGLEPILVWGEKSGQIIPQQLIDELGKLCRVEIYTEAGDKGKKGLATAALTELKYDRIFACGPSPMLMAIQKQSPKPVELSLEAYMACGVGVCLGCVVQNKKGEYVRVCKDGPVFTGAELW